MTTDKDTLEWAAQWIEDSVKGETNGRVIEFGKNMAMTLRAAATPPTATAAARECAAELERDNWLLSDVTPEEREQVAAIISKHFPSAVPKCTCCGAATCDCGPLVAPDSKVIDDPCRICGKCINHCPHQ